MPKSKHHCSSPSCDKADDDFMVSCDRCKRWWHYNCHDFNPELYDTATPWFCNESDCVAREEAEAETTETTDSQLAGCVGESNDPVDCLIEAAAVAQAAVAQRDKELVSLRAELEDMKLKLSESNAKVQSVGGETVKQSVDRLEVIKMIQANHQSLLNGMSQPCQSTPLHSPSHREPSSQSASIQTSDMANLLTILNRNNVQELPTFSGDNRREWPYFEQVYKSTTIEGRFSDKENVARLRKALKGEAYQLVCDRLKYSSNASAIMDSLRAIFGRSDVLVHDLTSELLNLPKLLSKSDPKIRLWAVKVSGYVADIRSMGREEDLTNGFVMTNLASKLCAGLYQEWQKKRASNPHTNFVQFAEFLSEKIIDLPPDLLGVSYEGKRKSQGSPKSSRRVLAHLPPSSSNASLCRLCDKVHHKLNLCEKFKALSAEQRYAYAKENSICFTCLDSSKHDWRACARNKSCGIDGCSRRHHPLLHMPTGSTSSALNSSASSFVPQPHVHSSHVGNNFAVMFKIVPIRIHGKENTFVDTYAFLDEGSSLTMLERDLFDELGLEGDPEELSLQWTKGVIRREDALRTTLVVSGVDKPKQYILKCVYTVRDLDLPAQSTNVALLKSLYPHLRGLPLRDLVDAKPRILLGLDQAKFLLGHGQRYGQDDEPCALKTRLGWIVYGSGNSSATKHVSCVSKASKPTMKFLFHDAIKGEEELHELVKRHFTTEEFGVMAPKADLVGREVSRALDIMERSIRLVDDQYEIGLLWSADGVKLPDSYPMAFNRLVGLEKSLRKKPHLLDWMNDYFRGLLSKGYARVASQEELSQVWPRVWYGPTFIVENLNKIPPEPRCVADVASKVNGVSLNTHLLKGPDNLVPLHAGIFKFREREIAVNADVKEMFHQIRISKEDQQCQRILWRDGDSSRKPTVYIMQVMMFGPRCSPTCAQFVKNTHANLFKAECPEAVDGLSQRTYVDDYFNSHDSVEKAVSVTRDAIRICKSMHFDLVGVQSNSREFLAQIPSGHVNPKLVSIDPNECEGYVAKILGMFWHPTSDNFAYKLADDEILQEMLVSDAAITKRNILRTIMRIFDPLGIISLYIIRGRIVLQEVWREGFDWDVALAPRLQLEWLTFIRELKNIEKLRIPRRYVSWNPDDCRVSLITFVDASEKAFAAIAYLRFERDDKVEVSLAMAKAKVAPVKQLSIPRLELQAAILGVRLASTVRKSHSIRIDEEIFLSDSKTVLSWIYSTTFKFPSFVATRVGEILDSTAPRQWLFVRSSDNVADDGTKWTESAMGLQATRWFNGPEFLRLPRSEWPVKSNEADVLVPDNNDSARVLLHERRWFISFSAYDDIKARFRARWSSSVRVVAFLLRRREIYFNRPVEKEMFVTPTEYARAEDWLFRKIQLEAFPTDLSSLQRSGRVSSSSSLLSLSPFLDEEGTIRMSSRAQKANLSYAARNPAILPKSHPLVDIFIQHHHDRNLHMGTATVISDIRERAWIIHIRGAVERVKSKCNTCKRIKAKPTMPLMGELPDARLAFELRPFTHVGVDCFGPLLVKFGRGTTKRYGMIFTCLTFRAVQVELLNDLSLDQCTMAVRRFVINRVVTRFFYSDNGLNFIGTKNLMEKDIRDMETHLSDYAAKYEGILWRFIPAYSPWMGGAWERLIQSIKKSVNFVLKGIVPREDVLRNALMEAQGQINRRPLTHLPVDPEDPRPLTPNSMLFGEADQDVTAPGVFMEGDQFSKLYNRRAQHLMSELTKRWYNEYLPEITRRSKWYKTSKPVQVDDIVLIIEPNEIRSVWQLGRVSKVYSGPDGVIRMADVRMPNGSTKFKRSVGRLAVLDLKSSP